VPRRVVFKLRNIGAHVRAPIERVMALFATLTDQRVTTVIGVATFLQPRIRSQ
jgi:hypothetical protein